MPRPRVPTELDGIAVTRLASETQPTSVVDLQSGFGWQTALSRNNRRSVVRSRRVALIQPRSSQRSRMTEAGFPEEPRTCFRRSPVHLRRMSTFSIIYRDDERAIRYNISIPYATLPYFPFHGRESLWPLHLPPCHIARRQPSLSQKRPMLRPIPTSVTNTSTSMITTTTNNNLTTLHTSPSPMA